MIDLGTVIPGSTIRIPINTFDSNDPSGSVTATTWLNTDCHIHKDGGTTQRASSSGETLSIDFDTVTGNHLLAIDLSDNTTANFYEAGSEYHVRIEGVTVDAGNVNAWIARFRIGYPGAILDTTIATLASQVSFTLEDGSVDNDAYNGCVAIIHDLASAVQVAIGYVSDYVGSTKTVTLAADPGIFTMAAGDNISLMIPANVTAVGGTAQTAGDIISDTETVLVDSEALLVDTEAVIVDTEATITDTEASQVTEAAVLVDTEAAITERSTLLTDTEAILTDTGTTLLADTEAILTDTESAISRLPAALVSGKMDSDTTSISGVAVAADRLEAWFNGFLTGTVEGTPSSTVFDSDVTEATNDHFNHMVVAFTGGALLGQSRRVSDYAGLAGTFTVQPAFTEAPGVGDTFIISPVIVGGLDANGRMDVGAVAGTAQTAGDIIADTEALLVDTEALPSAATIADAVWDEARSGHTTAGTYGEAHNAQVSGTVDNTENAPTTTAFDADDITEATADHYNGRIIIFTSGVLAAQATDITDYALTAGGRGRFTVTALTEAPGNNDTFIIV